MMSDLINKINQDLIGVQKSRDEISTSTLRLLLSDIKNSQIAKGGELTDDEIVAEVVKNAKKRKESIDAFKTAGRGELVEKESAELKVLEKYLPEQLTEEEIEKIVDSVISESGAVETGDFSGVMGQVMAKVKGKADGRFVSETVKKKLELSNPT